MRKTSTGLDSNDKSCRTNYTEVHVGLMLPLIFQSLCGHKISFVQHFTRIHLYLEQRIGLYEICVNSFFEGTFYVRSKFSCGPSSYGLCARVHARSLEGTLQMHIGI